MSHVLSNIREARHRVAETKKGAVEREDIARDRSKSSIQTLRTCIPNAMNIELTCQPVDLSRV